MKPAQPEISTIDEYIATFPEPIQELLQAVRLTIRNAAPGAGEKIGYRMPTFTLNGNLVHFAAFKKHIGLYPGSEAIVVFEKDLQGYQTSKGAIQFPLDQPIPFPLIQKIVQYRVQESTLAKKKKK